MRPLTLAAAAIAALFTVSPALAQQTAAPSAVAAPAVPTADEISAAGEAFGSDMEAMQAELQQAKTAAGTDTTKANAEADRIQAAYQVKADAFASLFKAFVEANPGMIPPDAVTLIMSQVQNGPAAVRRGVMGTAPAA